MMFKGQQWQFAIGAQDHCLHLPGRQVSGLLRPPPSGPQSQCHLGVLWGRFAQLGIGAAHGINVWYVLQAVAQSVFCRTFPD